MTGYVIVEYHPKTGLHARMTEVYEVDSWDELRAEAELLRVDIEESGNHVVDRLFIAEAV